MIKKELDLVKRLTGILNDDQIKFNDVGWASRVFLIDNGRIVFKFQSPSRRDNPMTQPLNNQDPK